MSKLVTRIHWMRLLFWTATIALGVSTYSLGGELLAAIAHGSGR